MTQQLYFFVSRKQLSWLKQGLIVFSGWNELRDPFLENPRMPAQVVDDAPLSDSEFTETLKSHYDAMDASMRNMVSWEYYLEQAKNNREKIEAQIRTPKADTQVDLPDRVHYQPLCCLRLFESVELEAVWHRHGDHHKGLAVAVDAQHNYLLDQLHAGVPQKLSPLQYDDSRPPAPSRDNPFPAWLRRAEHLAYEREWRLIRPVKSSDKQVDQQAAFKFPKGLITGLYLGLNVEKDLVTQLRQLVQQDLNFRHLPAWHMGVDPDYLRLAPVPLELPKD